MSLLQSKAHSVLFPVLEQLELNDDLQRFLDNGGRSLLFGETGEEYRNCQMSPDDWRVKPSSSGSELPNAPKALPGRCCWPPMLIFLPSTACKGSRRSCLRLKWRTP